MEVYNVSGWEDYVGNEHQHVATKSAANYFTYRPTNEQDTHVRTIFLFFIRTYYYTNFSLSPLPSLNVNLVVLAGTYIFKATELSTSGILIVVTPQPAPGLMLKVSTQVTSAQATCAMRESCPSI